MHCAAYNHVHCNWKIFIGVHGKFQILKGRETFANYNFVHCYGITFPFIHCPQHLQLINSVYDRRGSKMHHYFSRIIIIFDDKIPLIFFGRTLHKN